MDLKDFVKSTTQSIIDAAQELIVENRNIGIFVNPVMDSVGGDADVVRFYDGFLPVTSIDFDVAVTEETEKSAGGAGKIKIASFQIGADGNASKLNSSVSRIQFKMRVALPGVSGPDKSIKFLDYT